MRISFRKTVAAWMCIFVALCLCCKKKPVAKAPAELPGVVAKISDYVITKEDLEKRLLQELRPDRYEEVQQDEPPDVEKVLMEMVAEKAMIMDARKKGYDQDETIRSSVQRYKNRRLINMLLQMQLSNKLVVTDAEVDEKLKADPKLDRARAEALIKREKSNKLFNKFYSQLLEKFHVQKVKENFAKVAKIHQRLLQKPKEPRKVGWIRNSQVKNELTEEEKIIVLVKYDEGEVTLKDWFEALSEIAPPSRPKDLHTTSGVERMLDRAMRKPILLAEALSLALDKDEELIKQVREQENLQLQHKAEREKVKDIEEPTDEQIVEYFNNNKETFGGSEALKVDQIWCEDLMTANKAKVELDGGKEFEQVKQDYSLRKESKAVNVYPGSEGIFFKDLSKGEPNDIIGPIKGFYSDGIKWRIVSILERRPAQPREYSESMKGNVKGRMMDEQRRAILAKYREELLKEYSYEIYTDRIKEIDPLDIP